LPLAAAKNKLFGGCFALGDFPFSSFEEALPYPRIKGRMKPGKT